MQVTLAIVVTAVASCGGENNAATSTTIGSGTNNGAASSATAAPSPFSADRLSDLSGRYSGQWESETLGSGSASIDIDVDPDGQTVTVDFGLNGQLLEALVTELAPTDGAVNVMGGVNAVFGEEGTATGTGTLVGDYTITLTSDGAVAMTAEDVPGPHVEEIDVAGNLEPDCFTLEYRITFEGSDIVFAGSIELCRTEDGGIVIDNGGSAAPTRTIAEYTVEVLDQSAVDAVDGIGTTTASVTFNCADGRCDGAIAFGQINYPDGTGQRGGFREFTYDQGARTYLFDETQTGSCDQERWYGIITPTDTDDRGPTTFTFAGGHDGSGGCDYQLVYEMTATRISVAP